MGGQACVLYGSSEFSRDLDLAILVNPKNLANFQSFLTEIQAENIAVPIFSEEYLNKGHAIHFRAGLPELLNLRIDIMSRMRNVPEFEQLWARRTTLEVDENLQINLISIPDLVKAKKTARDKDWPMIRKLIDTDCLNNYDSKDPNKVNFYLSELRTPDLLMQYAEYNKQRASELVSLRPLLQQALDKDLLKLEYELNLEEQKERALDREYWSVLKKELEILRRDRQRS